MDALQTLFNRRSVRDFTAQPIEEEKLQRILEAGMSGPCCVNARDWSFIVVTDREKLLEMAEANGRPAQPLKKAAAAILICGDLERAFPPAKDYWGIDGAIAAQNMTMVIVNQAMQFARDVADRVVFMDGGRIVEEGPAEQVIDHPREQRTREFLSRIEG